MSFTKHTALQDSSAYRQTRSAAKSRIISFLNTQAETKFTSPSTGLILFSRIFQPTAIFPRSHVSAARNGARQRKKHPPQSKSSLMTSWSFTRAVRCIKASNILPIPFGKRSLKTASCTKKQRISSVQ